MALTKIAEIILLILLVVCAVGVNFGKSLLQAVIIFMSYSSIMCILWVLLESPDLAITEAAVGAGVSSVLFMLTLRRIHTEDLRMEALQQEAGMSDPVQIAEASQEEGSSELMWKRSRSLTERTMIFSKISWTVKKFMTVLGKRSKQRKSIIEIMCAAHSGCRN